MQASALVRQLRVMWGVGVGVTLEVLVAPECQHGAALATTLDTTTAPSQNLRLIEQWNFTIYDRRYERGGRDGDTWQTHVLGNTCDAIKHLNFV